MSLSKSQLKLIKSLDQKKYRSKLRLFVAEGVKVVKELLDSSLELQNLFVTEASSGLFSDSDFQMISEVDLKKISSLKSPNGVLAIFKIPEAKELRTSDLIVALDGINDPGNLGTIIRLCDWFGIEQLVCSLDTVDCYNNKVVQATMGSLSRVQINYVDLKSYLIDSRLPKYIADMDGENVYAASLEKEAILIMGNEANGIRPEIRELCSEKLTIPRFGSVQATESLNVATATAILLSEFKRSK